MKEQACILCGNHQRKTLASYSKPDVYEEAVGVSSKGYWRKWVRCQGCGFCYSTYSRNDKIIHKIYTDAYRSSRSSWRSKSPEQIFRHVVRLPKAVSETGYRVQWLKNEIRELQRSDLFPEGKKRFHLLDVGGGAGVFAFKFQDREWRSAVMDPSKTSVFLKKYKVDTICDYYRPHAFKRRFHLISFVYVLEHLANPFKVLKQVHRDMSSSSLLYIEVPDALCFEKKSLKDDIFNSCHLWMFDPKSLGKLLDHCGFQTVSVRRTHTFRGHYALMMLARRM